MKFYPHRSPIFCSAFCAFIAFQIGVFSSNSEAAASRPRDNGHFNGVHWKKITDVRGSSMDVPSEMRSNRDGDALVLKSRDGNLLVRFWTMTETRVGFPGNNPSGDMNLKRSDCESWPPAYHVVRDRFAAYSCKNKSMINYYIAKYNNSGGVVMFAKYPESSKAVWNDIISRMASSIKQVRRANAGI